MQREPAQNHRAPRERDHEPRRDGREREEARESASRAHAISGVGRAFSTPRRQVSWIGSAALPRIMNS